MDAKKWGSASLLAIALLVCYNGAQPGLYEMRTNPKIYPGTKAKTEAYGPSMVWLDRVMNGGSGSTVNRQATKLDMKILSSMMVAGMASGFRSQVANLLWMQQDTYSDKGETQRVIPIMEAVVTLDPQFVDAWSTTGWHWAYNLYADAADKTVSSQFRINPNDPNSELDPKKVRAQQDICLKTGLDYLARGAAANPDTYRLWFENGYTRAYKAGLEDDEAVRLMSIARQQADARVTKLENDKTGRSIDTIGHMMAHVYENRPDFTKALQAWQDTLLVDDTSKLPADEQIHASDIPMLYAAGEYWGRYGTHYDEIVNFYNSADATVKAQIKKLIPDVERMCAAHAVRMRTSRTQPTPTGAYVSLVARYLPAWKLSQSGKTEEAIATMQGVIKAQPKYHLQGLPVLAQVLAMRGDSPANIQKLLAETVETEQKAVQEIGLHFLAVLYEKAAAETSGAKSTNFSRLAYETWYRARVRNALDFYARTNTYRLEDKFGFQLSPQTIANMENSRNKNLPPSGDVDPPPSMLTPK